MAIERNPDQPTGIREPADDHEQWTPIYSALVRSIGEPNAWSWFAYCHFVRIADSTLTLAHWNSFSAEESLRRYGEQLARAAHVHRIVMHRTGGHLPPNIKSAKRTSGVAVFQLPTIKTEPRP